MHGTADKKWGTGKWIALGCGGCALLIVLCAAFAAGIAGIVFTSMKSSGAYQTALERACGDPEVIEALGEPIEDGLMVTGSINVNGPNGEASLAIPISGPDGNGTIYAEAEKSAGEWHFLVLEVAVAGRAERIDLLAEPEPLYIEPTVSA